MGRASDGRTLERAVAGSIPVRAQLRNDFGQVVRTHLCCLDAESLRCDMDSLNRLPLLYLLVLLLNLDWTVNATVFPT